MNIFGNEFTHRDKGLIISSCKDDSVKIKCLMNAELFLSSPDKELIIESMLDDDKKLGLISNQNIKINSESKKNIIQSFRCDELIIDSLKLLDTELQSFDKKDLLFLIKSEELILSALLDPEINVEIKDKINIIKSIKNDEAKKHYLRNNKTNIDEADKMLIISSLKDDKDLESLNFNIDESYKSSLNLPKDLSIGIELEAEGQNALNLLILGKVLGKWRAVPDMSLYNGVELVSPILYDTKEDMRSLNTVCTLMQELQLNASKRCGGHIHFGGDIFKGDLKAWESFFTIYNECEEIFYKMSNEAGEAPRERVSKYAGKSNHVFADKFESGDINLTTQTDFEQLMEELQSVRDRGVNLINLCEGGLNTIEFRIPNGTLKPQVIRENIKLYGSLLKTAKEMSLDPEHKREEFELIKDKELTEAEKVEVLLALLFEEEADKKIYRERWNLIKDNIRFEELKAEKPTFKRGDYSMKKETAKMFKETKIEDRIEFEKEVQKALIAYNRTEIDIDREIE